MTTMINTTIFLDEQAPDFSNAACTHSSPDLFFPESPLDEYFAIKAIQVICDGCPLKTECNEYADRYRLEGIWAGVSESERKARWENIGNNFVPRFQMIAPRAVELRALGLSKVDIGRRIGATPEMVARALKFAGVS
jgi:hypothetical protein